MRSIKIGDLPLYYHKETSMDYLYIHQQDTCISNINLQKGYHLLMIWKVSTVQKAGKQVKEACDAAVPWPLFAMFQKSIKQLF